MGEELVSKLLRKRRAQASVGLVTTHKAGVWCLHLAVRKEGIVSRHKHVIITLKFFQIGHIATWYTSFNSKVVQGDFFTFVHRCVIGGIKHLLFLAHKLCDHGGIRMCSTTSNSIPWHYSLCMPRSHIAFWTAYASHINLNGWWSKSTGLEATTKKIVQWWCRKNDFLRK